MDDENKIKNNEESSSLENDSNLANENENIVKTEKKSGNWFSRQSTIVKVIIGLVGVCCIGTIILFSIGLIMLPGMDTNTTSDGTIDTFSNEVSVAGVKFYLPDDFKSYRNDTSNGNIGNQYYNGEEYIGLTVYSSRYHSPTELITKFRSNSLFSNVQSASYGNYVGFTADFNLDEGVMGKIFVFEKDGKVCSVEMSTNNLNFDDSILRIIG